MKNLFPLLIFLLLAALGCKYLSPQQKLESEAANKNPNRTITNPPIFLNSQQFGTIADLNKNKPADVIEIASNNRTLSEALAEITKQREKDGVRLEGTSIVPTNVHLLANPELAVGPLAELYIAIDENAGDVYIPRRSPPGSRAELQKPDAFTLEVRTEPPTFEPYYRPTYDPDYKYSYNTSFEFAKTPESLLSYRAWSGSVELSADERYFINDAQGPEADEGPKHTKVKQRSIDAAALKDALATIPATANEIMIIVSEKASYASLLRIFQAGENLNVKFHIVVRRQPAE